MKFTCDSCGAQYMIGDQKLGKRGVKVRCKKCSYVIILRPPGYQPDKRPATLERALNDSRPRVPDEIEVPPSVDLSPEEGDYETTQAVVVSTESRAEPIPPALVFDETEDRTKQNVIAARPEGVMSEKSALTESAHLDVANLAHGPDVSSPFNRGPVGGSLVDNDEPTSQGVSSVPAHVFDDSVAEPTSIEHTPFAPDVPSLHGLENGRVGEDAPRKLNLAQMRPPVEVLANGDDALEERLAALDKNEMDDMQSSLNDSLGTGRWGEVTAPVVDRTERSPIPGSRAGEAGSPSDASRSHPSPASRSSFNNSRMAAATEDRNANPLPPFVPGTMAGLSMRPPDEIPPIDAPLDGEIKSAFEQMFSPSPGATNGDHAVQPTSNAEASDSVELFRSAYKDETTQRGKEPAPHVNGSNGHAAAVAEGPDAPEWYVAIDEEQVGPLSLNDVRARWEAGAVGPQSLCWKVGMPDWTTVREVEDLASLGDMDSPRPFMDQPEQADSTEAYAKNPPVIAMPDSDIAAARALDDSEDSVASWRPSAASALASLAQAELDSVDLPKKDRDVAGRALPVTSDALEKILNGESTAPSQFGAMDHLAR